MVVTKVAFTFNGMNDLVVQFQGAFEGAVADALDACGIAQEDPEVTSAGHPEKKGGKQCSIVIYIKSGMPTQTSDDIEKAIKSKVREYLPGEVICEAVCLPSEITAFQ